MICHKHKVDEEESHLDPLVFDPANPELMVRACTWEKTIKITTKNGNDAEYLMDPFNHHHHHFEVGCYLSKRFHRHDLSAQPHVVAAATQLT